MSAEASGRVSAPEKLLGGLIRRRWWLLAGLLAVTAAAVPFALRVGVDNSVDIWFVDGDPTLAAYKSFQKTFGNDETVVVGVELPDGVWSAARLNLLREVSERVAAVPGIRRVLSLATVKTISLDARDRLDVSPLVSGAVADDAAVAAIRARYDADPLLHKGFLSESGKMTMFVAQMEAMDDIDKARDEVITAVEGILEEELGGAALRYHISGVGVIYNALNRISQKDGAVFVGLSQLVIFVLLFLFFRRLGPTLLAIGGVALATAWLVGALGLAGRNINMVTMVLPTMVLVIGVADAIHILRHRAAAREGEAGGLARTLAFIVRPCLFTTLTTMAGFAALSSSKMAVVRDLGIFGALGIGFAFLTTVGFAAVALPGRFARPRPETEDRWQTGLQAALVGATRFALRNRAAVLGGTGLLLLAGAYGITSLNVDTNSLGFLPDQNPTVVATKAIEREMGPFMPLEFTVQVSEIEGIKEPSVLRALERWQAELGADEQIRDTLSLADVVARLHQVYAGKAAEVPDDPKRTWQLISLYENDRDNDRVHLSDGGYRTARVTAAVPMLSARDLEALIGRAMALAKKHFPKTEAAAGTTSVTVQPAGYLPLYVTMMDYIVESQVTSFGLAFLVVFLLVGLFFRSGTLAALSILPNILPVFVMLGVMGWAKINLDVATVTITAIVIGIAIDDTIHYLFRYRAELRANGGDHQAAAEATARGAGAAIAGTTVILAAGFLVLVGASVKSIAYFGLLSATAFTVAFLADLLLLPAMLSVLRPRL